VQALGPDAAQAEGVIPAMLRSMLFIPGDSEKKLAKADEVKADAVILDLEDAVAGPRKPTARAMVREFLNARPRANRLTKLYVRINPFESDMPLEDLEAIVGGNPDGVVAPKSSGAATVARVSEYLSVLEGREGIADAIKIVAIAGESAMGVLTMAEYAKAKNERLVGLSWGPWDLAADLGAAVNRDETGAFLFTYKMAM
jgi:citrate lyase subunit beta/citryl-CoA lyase